jgi:ureidoglycolate hydrolase
MNDKMGSRQYAKYDRTFMAFGSIINSLQNVMTEKNWQGIAEQAWHLARVQTSNLVEELYKENETSGAEEEKAL